MIDNNTNKKNRPFKMIYTDEIPKHLFIKHPEVISFYIYLKLKVWNKSHTTTYKGKEVKLEPNEITRSIRDLMKLFATTKYYVNKWLNILREERMISTNIEDGFTRIKILESRQNMERTPSGSLIVDDSVNNAEVDKPQDPISRTGLTSFTAMDLNDFEEENSTQYNIKSIIIGEEINRDVIEKKEGSDKNPFKDTDDVIDHINTNFIRVGNNMELTKIKSVRLKISKLIKAYDNLAGLKMEISKHFQGLSREQSFDMSFVTLYDYLMKKVKSNGNE